MALILNLLSFISFFVHHIIFIIFQLFLWKITPTEIHHKNLEESVTHSVRDTLQSVAAASCDSSSQGL